MTTRFARLFAPATLLVWGGVFVYFYGSGRLQSFLHPSLRPLVLVTGLGLMVAGLLLSVSDRSSALSAPSDPALSNDASLCMDGCGWAHSSPRVNGWVKLLVMLLPLTTAAVISPDGFGAAFVRNRVDASPSVALPSLPPAVSPAPANMTAIASAPALAAKDDEKSQYLKTDAAGHVKAELVDFRYAAQSPDLRKDLDHKIFEVIGQFLPTTGPDRQHFAVTRLFVICCAADAQPIEVSVKMGTPAAPPDLPEMAWVRIIGTVEFEHTDQIVATPVITAASVQSIPAPKEKYLY